MPASVLPTVPHENDDRPLPLIVAEKWNFPLAYMETDDHTYYAIQDWLSGLLSQDNIRKTWNDIQRKDGIPQLSDSIRQFSYIAQNGKTYSMDFATDKGLYLIAQHLRATKSRPALAAIKRFLAEAGAFVDEVRLNPDQLVESAIAAYRAQGKDDRWIQARIEGKIKRELFTRALSAAVAEMLTRRHYATATDDIYRGLWKRTAATLRSQLGLARKDSLRDHQPTLALDYQRIAEEICAIQLGEREELTWNEAREIVQLVAAFVGEQAQKTSQLLKMDIATGKPLLHA